MHTSALINAKRFFDAYVTNSAPQTVVDIGAQDVNGSIKDVTPSHLKYIGVDFVEAKGVDIVLTDPYALPFGDESVDIVVCSSCFEHSEMFWLLYLEILRILKPGGLFYLNVPSNGHFHRYPVDCWRFYPDSGQALINWAKKNRLNPKLLESFVSNKIRGVWNDYIAVHIKDESMASIYKSRITDHIDGFTNARVNGEPEIVNFRGASEDQRNILTAIQCGYWLWRERRAAKKLRKI